MELLAHNDIVLKWWLIHLVSWFEGGWYTNHLVLILAVCTSTHSHARVPIVGSQRMALTSSQAFRRQRRPRFPGMTTALVHLHSRTQSLRSARMKAVVEPPGCTGESHKRGKYWNDVPTHALHVSVLHQVEHGYADSSLHTKMHGCVKAYIDR